VHASYQLQYANTNQYHLHLLLGIYMYSFKEAAKLLAVPSTLAIAVSAAAQEQAIEQEELTVWGTQVFASSVDLDGEAIAIRQADHISDLLRTVPGVDVGGAHSLNQRITIRGMDDKDLQILIDGARQNTYMYHHMGNLQIHADILQSVDIQVGTNSVIDGGLGGAARFVTKDAAQLLKGDRNFGGRAALTASDNASDNLSLTAYGKIGDFTDFLLYYNGGDRKNYTVGGGEILDAEGDVVDGTDGKVRGLEGDLQDLMFKFGFDLSGDQRLKIGYEKYEDKGDYSYRPDMGLATDIAISGSLGLPLTFDTEFTRDTLTLNYDLNWGDGNKLRASAFQNDSTLWRDESAIQTIWPTDPGLVEGKASNRGFNILASSVLGAHELNYGIDIIDYETSYSADGVVLSGEGMVSRAVFVQDRIELGAFTLIPGVRFNSFDVGSSVVSDDYSKVTGALAGEFRPVDNLLIKLSSTQLFKAPDLNEVFIGAGLGVTENSDIDAEEGVNNELSLAFEDEVLGADSFSAGFTIFETTIENHIYQYAPPPAGVGGRYWYDNVGDLEIEGYEVYLGYDLGGLSTLLTISDSEAILDANAFYPTLDGAHDSREQGTTVAFNVDYEFTSLDLTLHWDVQHVDGTPHYDVALDAASLDNGKDAFTVHNISARWTPESVDGLGLTVGVDNLFDEFYASQSSRTGTSFHPRFGELYLLDYEPGRNIKATLSYQF
jgi:hemoglobin/transferrin/lactoferrin receptor protein